MAIDAAAVGAARLDEALELVRADADLATAHERDEQGRTTAVGVIGGLGNGSDEPLAQLCL